MMNRYLLYFLFILTGIVSCKKSDVSENIVPPLPHEKPELSYGDSIFYVTDSDEDNIVYPLDTALKGTFSGFPEGVELDEATGAVNVDKSETGLRYRITFISEDNIDTVSTIILLSGISYLDKIYPLDANDTSAFAVYNGRTEYDVPGTDGSSFFDEGGGCNNAGVAVNTSSGTINLAQTVKNGIFGDVPSNGAQKEVELSYRLYDQSQNALNRLKIKLYYFDTPDDIPQDLVQEMNERRDMFIGLDPQPPFLEYYNPSSNGLGIVNNSVLETAKPRPPCVFIVGRASK